MSDEVKYDLPPGPQPRAGYRWLAGLGVLVIGGIIGFSVRPVASRGLQSARTSGQADAGGASGAAADSLLSHAELRTLAETLERNQLYAEAACAWEQAARQAPPQGADKAATLFRIGKNYCLAHEHERAMSYLFAAEAADQEGKWKASLNKLVLEGLSALGLEDVRAHQAAQRIALEPAGDEASKTVAEIGGEPVTELDLRSFARRMVTQQLSMQRQVMSAEAFEEAVESGLDRFRSAEGRQQLLQMYVSQELLYREALAAGLPEHEEVRQRTSDARRGILTDAYLREYLDRNLHIDETDLENAYEANKAEYVEPEAFKAEAIVVETEEAKEQVSEALNAGTAFAEVRAGFSTRPPEGDGPDPFDRWITRGGWVPMVADSRTALAHIVSLQVGEVGGKWFEGTGGTWLRLKLADHRPARQLALSECRERVERDLRAAKQSDLLRQLQRSLQDKYQVVIREDALKPEEPEAEEESS